MAAHLRPRVQTTTNRERGSGSTRRKPAAVKCSGLLAGVSDFAKDGISELREFCKVCGLLGRKDGNNDGELLLTRPKTSNALAVQGAA